MTGVGVFGSTNAKSVLRPLVKKYANLHPDDWIVNGVTGVVEVVMLAVVSAVLLTL